MSATGGPIGLLSVALRSLMKEFDYLVMAVHISLN